MLQVAPEMKLSRRALLIAAAFAPEAFARSSTAGTVMTPNFWNQPRWVWLKRAKTDDEIRAVYWADGQLIVSEYEKICWFLRDRAAGKAMYMNPVLLDVIYAQCGWLKFNGIERPYISTSGARFPETNSKLEGAAKNSQHLLGNAHDGYIEGINIEVQNEFAKWLGGGGVGYYRAKNFIHTDVGNIRYWRG
ncbi:hypothetical protein BV908_08880 [Diaphorobacter sp. LR2014-1]|nr:hypothetical protein BV908_08880 [Diaphorobacter sp. LR2014-1]